MYGASWIAFWMALSSMSDSDLSGTQISGGGSSPNSSRMTSARDVINQHSIDSGGNGDRGPTGGGIRRNGKSEGQSEGKRLRRPEKKQRLPFYGQLISQIDGPVVVIEQVFGVLSCVATACQLGGGPGSAVAAIVTPTVETTPWEAPFPEK